MAQQWPPADPTADDHRRTPTHRMVCFQQADQAPGPNDGSVASWCALYPLSAGPFTEPEVLVRLTADRTRLLDLDTGAAVSATQRPDRRWEVRPLTGGELMVTNARSSGDGPGFAEAKGFAPLIVPRPGRAVSPYAKAVAGRKWVPSPSLETVGGWRRRRRRAVAVDAFAITTMVGAAAVSGVAGNPAAILFGGVAVYTGAGIAWRRWRDRLVTVGEGADVDDHSAGTSGPSMRTMVDLDWRPSLDWGALAWVVIADDEHGQLEAPVAGLTSDEIDGFPTMATVDGAFGSGKPVRLTLDGGAVFHTIRPLRRSQ